MRTRRGRVCALQRECSKRPPRRLRARRLSLRGHMPQRAGLLQVRGPQCFPVFFSPFCSGNGCSGFRSHHKYSQWTRWCECPRGLMGPYCTLPVGRPNACAQVSHSSVCERGTCIDSLPDIAALATQTGLPSTYELPDAALLSRLIQTVRTVSSFEFLNIPKYY